MRDEDFARLFEAGGVTPAEFGHLAHVRVAWVYLQESGSAGEALAKMRSAIQRFALAAGVPQKYHETITVLWMRLLAAVRAQGAAGELADVVCEYPALADKDLPLRYYSRERLFSDEARLVWLAPDRQPSGVIAFDDTET